MSKKNKSCMLELKLKNFSPPHVPQICINYLGSRPERPCFISHMIYDYYYGTSHLNYFIKIGTFVITRLVDGNDYRKKYQQNALNNVECETGKCLTANYHWISVSPFSHLH